VLRPGAPGPQGGETGLYRAERGLW